MQIKIFLAGIIILGLVVYGRILGNGFVGDDPGYINHPYVQNFQLTKLFTGSSTDLGGNSPITGYFYRPVMLVVLAQVFQISGDSPWLYHLIQLGLHMTNTILVYMLLVQFMPKKSAQIASLIFLVHPINTETVAYISNLQDVLFVLFGLTALNLTVRKKAALTITLMLFLALLAKETGVMFLACSLLYIWYTKQKDLQIWIFRILGVITSYLFLRLVIAGIGVGGLQKTVMGSLTLGERAVHIPKIILYYLQTMVWPGTLAVGQTWTIKSDLYTFYIPLGIVIILMIFVILNIKSKAIVFFLIWLGLGIALHLQIIPLEMTVADRWWYFPIIGCLGLAGSVLPKRIVLAMAVIIPILAIRTWIRTGDFKDAMTLYKHDAEITESYLLEQAYGYELMQKNELNEAKIHLDKSIKLFENTTNTNSLGVVYFRQKDIDGAIGWFEKSIHLGDNFQAYNNLARLLMAHKSPNEAVVIITSGTEKFPQSDNFWFLLALAEYKRGNEGEALAAAQKAVAISPSGQNVYVLRELQGGREIKIND